MAKQLLFNQGSGGGLSGGTVLWDNPNKTVAFAGQYIDLPDFSRYQFISVKSLSYVGDNLVTETIWRVSDFVDACTQVQGNYGGVAFGVDINNVGYARQLNLEISTGRYQFSDGYSVNTMLNNVCIPQQIIGY